MCLVEITFSIKLEISCKSFLNLSEVLNFNSDTNVVEVAIKRLRTKVDTPADAKLIHTVRGMGYVLEDASDDFSAT